MGIRCPFYIIHYLKLINMKGQNLNAKFNELSEAQKAQIFKIFEANDKRTEAAKRKEFLKLEKIAVKESYKGLFNIFNLIKKESTFVSIKTSKFQAVNVLGVINFNQFLQQMKAQGAYTFDNVWSFVEMYENANDGDKMLIESRGAEINALIMNVKKGELSKLEAIQSFVEIGGAPFRVDKKGVRKCTLTKGSAKVLFNEFPTLYRTFGVSEYLPEIHNELTAISEEISAEELETAK